MTVEPGLEGRLDIDLAFDGSRISSVRLRSSRPIGAVSMFHGKPIDQVVNLIPVMFSLCGRAQTIAGLAAAEAALKLSPSSEQRALRDLLILAEAVEQDALRMVLDWSALIGRAPDVSVLQDLRRATQGLMRTIGQEPAWKSVGPEETAVDWSALKAEVKALRDAMEPALKPNETVDSLDQLKIWMHRQADDLLPSVLHWVNSDGWARLGATRCTVLGRPDLMEVNRYLSGEGGRDFERAPTKDGNVCETGPVDGLQYHPIVKEIIDTQGLGLMARLVARCLHLWQIPEKMNAIIIQNSEKGGEDLDRSAAHGDDAGAVSATVISEYGGGSEQRDDDPSAIGIAAVETARGWLVHRVIMDSQEQRILDYRTVAPTEWNFHPDGPLKQGLIGVPCADWEEAKQKASTLVTALDPCVSFRINEIAKPA